MSNIISLNTEIREATWANIGCNIQEEMSHNVKDALESSGLNFTVEKQPMFLGDGTEIADKVACVAKVGDKSNYLGIVSPRYEIIQNEDAFKFVDYISDDVQFVKSGITHTGMVYLIGQLPETKVLDDSFTPYVIFQNSFNGRYNLSAAITPLRVVCQNQFAISFAHSTNKIALRHSAQANYRMEEGKRVLAGVAEHMRSISAMAENFSKIKMSPDMIAHAIDMLFPIPVDMKDALSAKVEEKKKAFIKAYNMDDNANHKGTAWGLVNAYTDFATHFAPPRTKYNDALFIKNVDNNTTDTIIDIIKKVA